jgi:hypothetical protein
VPTATPAPTATPVPVIDLIPNKTTFSTTDRISVTANVQVIATPCYPFVRVILPNGQTQYLVRGKGLVRSPQPYVGKRPMTVSTPIGNYPVLDVGFRGIAPGTYYLEGGAVDATQTTSASHLVYVDGVDREALVVQ